MAPLTSAARAWNMSPTSSGPIVTVAALRQYGLIEDEGSGSGRKVRVSHDALRIILDKVATSPSRQEALRRAFLAPKVFSELWERWKVDLPSEQTMINYLVLERKLSNQAPFSEQSASELLANYRVSLPFALPGGESSVPPPIDKSGSPPKMEANHSADYAIAHPLHQGSDGRSRAPAYTGTDGDLNVLLTGGRLEITANVDLAGLERLKEVLGHYEQILKLVTPKQQDNSREP